MRKMTAPAIAAELKYAARFAAEKAWQQKRYCDAFELWRSCSFKRCKHNRRCCGEVDKCLAKAVALDQVPRRLALQTRQNILAATPRNIGAPERAARQCMPIDFYLKAEGVIHCQQNGVGAFFLLPLPVGERAGVRGSRRFELNFGSPSPARFARDLSPTGRGEEGLRWRTNR